MALITLLDLTRTSAGCIPQLDRLTYPHLPAPSREGYGLGEASCALKANQPGSFGHYLDLAKARVAYLRSLQELLTAGDLVALGRSLEQSGFLPKVDLFTGISLQKLDPRDRALHAYNSANYRLMQRIHKDAAYLASDNRDTDARSLIATLSPLLPTLRLDHSIELALIMETLQSGARICLDRLLHICALAVESIQITGDKLKISTGGQHYEGKVERESLAEGLLKHLRVFAGCRLPREQRYIGDSAVRVYDPPTNPYLPQLQSLEITGEEAWILFDRGIFYIFNNSGYACDILGNGHLFLRNGTDHSIEIDPNFMGKHGKRECDELAKFIFKKQAALKKKAAAQDT